MKTIYKLSTLILIVSITTGCKKYLDVNFNPSVPQVTSAEILLPPIQYQMTNGTSQDYRFIWKVTQDMAGIATASTSTLYYNWEQHGYADGSDLGGVIWRMTYVDLGLNLENLIKDAVDNQKYEYAGIGYAIKAWAYQQCTDLHGPIILDEAFDPKLLVFKYQEQPEVYAKVREWASLSIKYFNMTSPKDYSTALAGPSGDQIYKGDKAKWKKFVYSLLALQYSHLINKPEFKTQYADSVIKYTNLSYANETESSTVNFTATSAVDSNPFGQSNTGTAGMLISSNYFGYPTTTILNYLTGGVRGIPTTTPTTSLDPRLKRLIAPNALGEYSGVIPAEGSSTTNVPKIYGLLPAGASGYNGRYIFSDAARYPLMTYSQLQFVKAEAAFYKNDKATAFTSYINGIKGHMDFVNQYGRSYASPQPAITTTETNAYLASTEVAQNSASLTLADIMAQKYIAQWGWAALEQWTDIRKYHYDPTIYTQYHQFTPDKLASTNNGKYAYRFRPRYASEYVWNLEELIKFGGDKKDYHTNETWFSLP